MNGKPEGENIPWLSEAESKGALLNLADLVDLMAEKGMTQITLHTVSGRKLDMQKSDAGLWKLTLSG
jgi:hypothetical protein